MQQIGASMYEQQPEAGAYEQPNAAPGPGEAADAGARADADQSNEAEASEEDVVEGEFEET